MGGIISGRALHFYVRRSEWTQGVSAPLGFATLIPYTLQDTPQSAKAVKLLFGTYAVVNASPNLGVPPTISGAQGRLACLGVDFSVNLQTRQITWLPTARWPLVPDNFVVFDYYSYGWTA